VYGKAIGVLVVSGGGGVGALSGEDSQLLANLADRLASSLARAAERRDRVLAQEELAAANAKLIRSNKDLEEFAFVASHDLQEPIRAVVSFTALLARRNPDLDEKSLDYMRRAQNAALRMQTLIEDLLTYSRVGSRHWPFAIVRTADVVAEVVNEFSAAIERTGATVKVADLPDVAGQESQIHQLFQNLIGNALKYAGAEPAVIDISVAEDQAHTHWWQFAITDNGIGFDPMFAEKVFVIFRRLHARDEYSGTGIGLAICKRVVERHGGRIWAESEPGVGTTIRFTLRETS